MDRFLHLPLICVLHVRNAARFGMPLEFLEHLRRNNLPTIISTFHFFELWLLTLLFHLMCCHRWAKFTKNYCVWFLDSYLVLFVLSVMFCYNCSQFVIQFIVALLLNFRCSKTVRKAIERGSSRMIAVSPVQNSVQKSVHSPVHSPVQSPASRFYTDLSGPQD